jgi:6-phosphogluconolactonase
VPPFDNQRNFRRAEEHFIAPARFPGANVHRVMGELPPQAAAKKYAEEIRHYFGTSEGEIPQFDVIHRGIGSDCHTASLFPGEPLIEDREHLAAAVHVAKLNSWRVTLLPGVLLNARHTVMLVCGADKATPLKEILEQPYQPTKYPAQLTMQSGRDMTWFVDEAAAARMEQS